MQVFGEYLGWSLSVVVCQTMTMWLHTVSDVTGALADVSNLTDVSGTDGDSGPGPTVRHRAHQLPSGANTHKQTNSIWMKSQPVLFSNAPALYLTCSSGARRPPPYSDRCFHCGPPLQRHAPSPWQHRLHPWAWSTPPHTPSDWSWGRSAPLSSAENYRQTHLHTNTRHLKLTDITSAERTEPVFTWSLKLWRWTNSDCYQQRIGIRWVRWHRFQRAAAPSLAHLSICSDEGRSAPRWTVTQRHHFPRPRTHSPDEDATPTQSNPWHSWTEGTAGWKDSPV